MAGLKAITSLLIDQVEATEIIDSRFINMRCVNVTDTSRKGVCSLVFSADDILEDEKVAIKFLDPAILSHKYYPTAFNREPVLIAEVSHKPRCLSLVRELSDFSLQPTEGVPISINIPYFVTEWIDDDIEDYFQSQHEIVALEKLEVYRLALLSIESIHASKIHHRDIKADNFKRKTDNGRDLVVAIDFGTAAHIEMMGIFSIYDQGFTPGASGYSGPECEAGLSGYRDLGDKTDVYALGCLLYELFNSNYLFHDINKTSVIPFIKLVMQNELSSCKNYEEMIKKWGEVVGKYEGSCVPPVIDGLGHTMPLSVIPVLSELYVKMVAFDFNKRLSDLSEAREVIDTAILILRNNEEDKKRRAIRIEKKRRRQVRAERQQRKLEEYLDKQKKISC